jgi:hypothetical protein
LGGTAFGGWLGWFGCFWHVNLFNKKWLEPELHSFLEAINGQMDGAHYTISSREALPQSALHVHTFATFES